MNHLTSSALICLACSALMAQETSSRPPVDPGIQALKEMGASYRQAVVNVTLSPSKPFHGDEFKKMATLASHLLYLEMDGVPVADEGLRDIWTLSNLTELSLCQTRITDDALKHLARLRHLRVLRLAYTEVTGASLSELVHCPLIRLNLAKTKLNEEGQKQLALLPALTGLELAGTLFDNKAMVHLKPLTNLMELGLHGTQLEGDGGLAEIDGRMPRLTSIALSGTRVDDQCIQHLAGFPRLVAIYLDNSRVTAEGMRQVAQLGKRGYLQDLIILRVSPKQLPPEVHADLIGAFDNLQVKFVEEPEPVKAGK